MEVSIFEDLQLRTELAFTRSHNDIHGQVGLQDI
jgi:hypothetical protein